MVLTGGREEATAGAGNLPSGTLSPHTYLTAAGHRSRTKERRPQIPDPLGHAVLERQTDNSKQSLTRAERHRGSWGTRDLECGTECAYHHGM